MAELKIIGYTSDSAFEELCRLKQQANINANLKRTISEKNRLEAEHRKKSDDREAHVYLIDGEKRYYRIYRGLDEFKGKNEVKYLGIGLEPNLSVKQSKPKKIKQIKKVGLVGTQRATSYYKEGMHCCYCETRLTVEICTREHVVPKRVGGKYIKPCCSDCNKEKGGLMLHSYITFLNLKAEELLGNPVQYNINQTKIKNANEIAKQLNL